MYAGSFRIYMEQRTVIHFFMLNGLKAGAIHTELESVYGTGALAPPTLKKWWGRFYQGRTDLFDEPRVRKPIANT
jgi:hypothetical protein